MKERFNSGSDETYIASDGTGGWLDHVPTQEEVEEDHRKQEEANRSMNAQIEARQEELGIKQPVGREWIDSLRSDFDIVEPEKPGDKETNPDEVVADLRELFKN
ncbi:hypothetical protein A3K01_01290 [candidate division WWE3 bacterium RIFOXYD1_FULL_43_17]|uniref:Uncharacterized protein n=3 Tax=Katanobacteria TaxID=422282 RepID=A0A1F4XBA7_UNCKA|nr:MAG: hypothetical protein UU59_C0010G0002 [candidate division WWE3 bacterium GW2011_GWE1_41_27]KKS60601.1 MAG: hypothetical protein UV26_C0003G0055 [candidate division WWE3 bacterium GW2011_GWF2_42_42]OGC78934.1 MAG: hypothetical protein A3K01_01290 [candidate division WWE3 bacterium RIFOXYD1_FULL_43_17]